MLNDETKIEYVVQERVNQGIWRDLYTGTVQDDAVKHFNEQIAGNWVDFEFRVVMRFTMDTVILSVMEEGELSRD